MPQRLISALIAAPIAIFIIIQGGLWLRLALLLIALRGLYELFRAVSGKRVPHPIHFAAYIFTPVHFFVIIDNGQEMQLMAIAAFLLITIALTVINYQKSDLQDCLVTIGGFFYIPFLLSFLYLVRDHSVYFVWLIFVCSSASDTFAYIIGKKFGRHKLVNSPSPGKTWEGCIGGVAGAAIVGFIYGYVVHRFTGIDHPMVLNATAVSAIGAVFSQFGDLFASAIKRWVGIKDFGRIMPGHGGIVDRLDSIVVTAPVVYMVMIWML